MRIAKIAHPMEGLESLIGYKAGVSYLRLVRERGVRPGEAGEVKSIDDAIREFKQLPFEIVTSLLVFLYDGDQTFGSDLVQISPGRSRRRWRPQK
jgi:hypothetical protein